MFQVEKKRIGSQEKCYALGTLRVWDGDYLLAAAETRAACSLIDMDGKIVAESFHGEGGVMTMAQLPGRQGQFLTTQKFYGPDDSRKACLSLVTVKEKGDWEIRKIMDCPFLHRFGILNRGAVNYLILCSLKSDQIEEKGDWRFPGKVFWTILPQDLTDYGEDRQLKAEILKEGLSRNHGFCLHQDPDGNEEALVFCEEGTFLFTPPSSAGKAWAIQMLSEDPASDGLLLDLDGDGKEELLTIAPFHGDSLKIYHLNEDGCYALIWTYPEKLPFLHAIWGGEIQGKASWIVGNRDGERLTLAITAEDGAFCCQILDRGQGAANVLHYQKGGRDYILAANREVNEMALYALS